MNLKGILIIIASVLICLIVGYLSGISTASSVESWYPELRKPVFNPPSWIFAPVWTILYVLMGISLGLILTQNSDRKKVAVILFLSQLAANALWSVLFFGLRSPGWAFLDIVILIFLIAATIREFLGIHKTAGILLVPYILWVVFASMLNLSIWILN